MAVAGFAQAAEIIQGPIVANVIGVTDGDTFHVTARPWPGISVRTAVRVAGVDTPEMSGDCPEERDQANRARDFVVAAVGLQVVLRDITLGKYAGRVVASVEVAGGRMLHEMLIAAGLGRPYGGGRREPWCE